MKSAQASRGPAMAMMFQASRVRTILMGILCLYHDLPPCSISRMQSRTADWHHLWSLNSAREAMVMPWTYLMPFVQAIRCLTPCHEHILCLLCKHASSSGRGRCTNKSFHDIFRSPGQAQVSRPGRLPYMTGCFAALKGFLQLPAGRKQKASIIGGH